jgi:hypothetical protein
MPGQEGSIATLERIRGISFNELYDSGGLAVCYFQIDEAVTPPKADCAGCRTDGLNKCCDCYREFRVALGGGLEFVEDLLIGRNQRISEH